MFAESVARGTVIKPISRDISRRTQGKRSVIFVTGTIRIWATTNATCFSSMGRAPPQKLIKLRLRFYPSPLHHHFVSVDFPQNTQRSAYSSVDRPHICNICGARYKNHRHLLDHKKCHTSLTFCLYCNKHLSTVSSYRAHMKYAHDEWL